MAEISGDAFDLVEETVDFLGAAAISEDRLQLLLLRLQRLRRENVPAEQMRHSLKQDAPSLAHALDELSPPIQRVVAFFLETVVQLILGSLPQDGPPRPATPDDVREAAEHALQHQRMFPR